MRRKRRVNDEVLARAVQLATSTSTEHAARMTGISGPTIRKELHAAGLKTGGRRHTPEAFQKAVEIAAATSQRNAERATGIGHATIRREMRVRGIAPRRRGNFTRSEAEQLAGRMVGV